MAYIESIGKYFLLLKEVFRKPEKTKVYIDLYFREIEDLGLSSFGLVAFFSFFIGAVVSLQMAFNMGDNPFIANYYIALSTRESIILEFSPTIISIILAGKVGSYIASSIGAMRVTEQIDALEVMGVNSISYLIAPKVAAAVTFFPLLVMSSMVLGIFGGWFASVFSGVVSTTEYVIGLQMSFKPFYVVYALIKTVFFAFVIATIPAYFGYYVKGGSLEVGRSATKAVVWTTVAIILINYVLTQLLLV
ncbi:MAG: ABC transporter permease [Ichthyobacteriaceae bacterium]|nr:ABC transporter permease [Ichthyobacteriaceae bacterium]